MKRLFLGVGLTASLLAAAAGRSAGTTIVLPRAGQVGFGIQGQFGTLLQSGDLGSEFGSGAGMALRVRYRMRYERAIGLSFESQQLDSRAPGRASGAFDPLTQAGDTLLTRDRIRLVTAGVEVYQLFGTRTRTVRMVSAGFGLAQVTARLSDGETQYPIQGDGMFFSLGAGVERFFYRTFAWDLSTRYQGILQGGKLNHDAQVSLGLIMYAAY